MTRFWMVQSMKGILNPDHFKRDNFQQVLDLSGIWMPTVHSSDIEQWASKYQTYVNYLDAQFFSTGRLISPLFRLSFGHDLSNGSFECPTEGHNPNTVGIWIPEKSEEQTFTCMLFKWFARYPVPWANSRLVFKWWSEYRSINQMVIWILNFHDTRHLNSAPFNKRTNTHDLNTQLVCFSDPHCTELAHYLGRYCSYFLLGPF